jgi:hypothetical protein
MASEQKQVNNILDNEHVTIGVSVFLVLFASIIAPKLPLNILNWFNNWIVQIALFFAILYISDKNITIAIIATTALLITIIIANTKLTLNTLSNANTNIKSHEGFISAFNEESDEQSPINPMVMNMNREYLNQVTDQSNNSSDLSAGLSAGLSADPMRMDVANIQRSGVDVEGICDESISQHDDSMALQEYAIDNSQKFPVNESKIAVNNDSVNTESVNNIVGIKQYEMEDETMGSALNSSESMGSDHGSANHDDIKINTVLISDSDSNSDSNSDSDSDSES